MGDEMLIKNAKIYTMAKENYEKGSILIENDMQESDLWEIEKF